MRGACCSRTSACVVEGMLLFVLPLRLLVARTNVWLKGHCLSLPRVCEGVFKPMRALPAFVWLVLSLWSPALHAHNVLWRDGALACMRIAWK